MDVGSNYFATSFGEVLVSFGSGTCFLQSAFFLQGINVLLFDLSRICVEALQMYVKD